MLNGIHPAYAVFAWHSHINDLPRFVLVSLAQRDTGSQAFRDSVESQSMDGRWRKAATHWVSILNPGDPPTKRVGLCSFFQGVVAWDGLPIWATHP